MHGPVQAILWQLWRRHRWGLSADLAYLVIAPAIVELLPLNMGKLPIANLLGLVGVTVLTHLVGVCTYGFEADLAKKESGYPPRAFVLPVTNWTLVSWPSLGGAAALIAAWLVTAAGVWRPGGYETPLWWPGAAIAALLGMSQAIGWTPFAYHWLRLVLAILTVASIAAVAGVAIALFEADERWLFAGFAAVWMSFVAAAYVGLGRARRGESVSWRWFDRVGSRLAASSRAARAPFRSPLRAQLWVEMRRHGWMLPIFLATVLFCLIPVFFGPKIEAIPAWRILAIMSGLPPMLAGIVAIGFGKADPLQRGMVMPQFMATRPLSCAHFVAAKMLAAAVTVLISCGLMLAVLLPWFLRSDTQQSLSAFWQGVPSWKVAVVATLAIAYWIALSWRQLAAALWVALTGREWISTVNSFAFALLLVTGSLGGIWLSYHSEYHQRLLVWVSWCLATMVIVKVVVASWCTRQLVVRSLMSPYVVSLLLAVWCIAVACSCGLLVCLTPRDLWARLPIAQIIGGVVLMIPFTRLAGAPLALSFNRHR